MSAEEDHEGWHLDKRVPVALIVTLFVAVCSGVYAYSRLEGAVETHATRLARLEIKAEASDQAGQRVLTQVTRLDATLTSELAAIKSMLQELRRDLRQSREP